MINSVLKSCLVLVLMLTAATTVSAQPRESIEGIHYQPLDKPVATETDPDKIEVREIFWYGCPECSTLEPLMTQWRDGVTGDLFFVRSPAVWNDIMALHARIFYAAGVVGQQDRIHRAAFTAIQQHNNPLRTEQQIKELFLANGVGGDEFDMAWQAPEVISAVELARQRTQEYGVDKLPSVIVNGVYRVTQNQAVSDHIELNIAVNMVIMKFRDIRRID